MNIKFCKKCGGILIPLKEKELVLKCKNCDSSEKHMQTDYSYKEKIRKKEKINIKPIKEKNIYATYEHKCKKCGYNKAEIIDRGVFYTDEDHLIQLKCGKCGFAEILSKKPK